MQPQERAKIRGLVAQCRARLHRVMLNLEQPTQDWRTLARLTQAMEDLEAAYILLEADSTPSEEQA